MLKKINRILTKGLVIAVAIAPLNVWAKEEVAQFVSPSLWALEEFVDAEAYGVLPKDWYIGLRNPITEESFKYILEGVDFKLSALGVKKIEQSKVVEIPKALTRGNVLMSLHQQLLQYNWDEKIDLQEKEPLEWMKTSGILKGDTKGENLDRECTLEEALSFATRLIEELYAQYDKGAKGLVWEAINGENKVYLVGTVHMGNSFLYPFHKSLDEKFKASEVVAFEVDFNNQEDMQYLQEQQFLTDGTTLKDYVSEQVYVQTLEAFKSLGLTEEQVNSYKPMTLVNVMTVLSAQEEPTSELPLPVLDIYLQSKAYATGKEVVELEGIRYQTDFLYNAPMETQVMMLEDTIKEIQKEENTEQTSAEIINGWLKLWAAGEEEAFEKSFPKNEKTGVQAMDDFNEELFDKRDKHMTEKVVEMLNNEKGKTYMVVVGAGHMIGETGIVKGLQDLGYTVVPCK